MPVIRFVRYAANLSRFKGDQQISFIGQLNNTNKQNLPTGYFGSSGASARGGGFSGGRGGGSFGGGGGSQMQQLQSLNSNTNNNALLQPGLQA